MAERQGFPSPESAQWWLSTGEKTWQCLACMDHRNRLEKNAIQHERTQMHRDSVNYRLNPPARMAPLPPEVPPQTLPAIRHLLHEMAAGSDDHQVEHQADSDSLLQDISQDSQYNGNVVFDDVDDAGSFIHSNLGRTLLSQALLDYLDNDELSADEFAERSEESETEAVMGTATAENTMPIDAQSQKRSKTGKSDEWYPYPNKIACTIDILMHLPRSVFSERQLDILLWLLRENDICDIPSVKSMKNLDKILQSTCGIRTLSYQGALGHKYFVNSLADIIAQEMANPRVRPHLRFFPEDAGRKINEYWQASHWANEMDIDKLTPMTIIDGQHYFVNEPCLLKDGSVCMPAKWFIRDEKLFAKAWPLHVAQQEDTSGWVVEEYHELDICQDMFLVAFGSWCTMKATSNLPHPTNILGTIMNRDGVIAPWTRTNPHVGNRWRSLATGARVYSFPIWLYCDDTSGNMSKRWNKHNSFLFTPAGLPRKYVHQEYNIHFLCTSNLAPPLEMLDGVVEQLELAWDTGIWAWDCVHQERVLVIPFVVALLGDNPMQSEFACHIGLGGKYFCRACRVTGSEGTSPSTAESMVVNSREGTSAIETTVDEDSDLQSDVSRNSAVSITVQGNKKKKQETMASMLDRVKRFICIGEPRSKLDSVEQLKSMFTLAKSIGNQTKIQTLKTNTGLKDTYFDFFANLMFQSYKTRRGVQEKQQALDTFVTTLPQNIFSPVWRIKGLDPHQDTPVEVLHTVLLGFVKYFWRDVVHNQLKTNASKKLLLETRLSSVDVTGLGISKLSGHTLVQYAGSLTGRDFRVIAQVGPFVLYDMVPILCFNAWVALSHLVPLVWQPEIPDIDEHAAKLEAAIQSFLICTAKWTPRWFNKPKFHIILHLVTHVRRFGPASLFATEGFESFNAVIRAKSVHSNRLAPSRDIALAFAQGNRIRQLLSGGLICMRSGLDIRTTDGNIVDAKEAGLWHRVGPGPLSLVARPNAVTDYLGLDNDNTVHFGSCVLDGSPSRPYGSTKTGIHFPEALPVELRTQLFKTSKSLTLFNGNVCTVGSWVLARGNPDAPPQVCCIEEIIQRIGSANERRSHPDAILLQEGRISEFVLPYLMPGIQRVEKWLLLPTQDLLCAANLQHRCADNGCDTSEFEYVREERENTQKRKAVVAHKNPADLLLNTACMHDSVHFNKLRYHPQLSHTDIENSVLAGVTAEINNRKARAPGVLGTGQTSSQVGRLGQGRPRSGAIHSGLVQGRSPSSTS